MKQILILDASPRGPESASRKVSARLKLKLSAKYPSAKIIARDLAGERFPSLDGDTLQALAMDAPSSTAIGKLSESMTEEFLASDLLVISTPMWNFGLPPTVKAWLDLVVRRGKTFAYTANGAEGLAKGKSAVLIISSGGVFTEGPWKPWDFVEPYLRLILGFMGIDKVHTVRVEGLNIPNMSALAVPKAEAAIEHLAV